MKQAKKQKTIQTKSKNTMSTCLIAKNIFLIKK